MNDGRLKLDVVETVHICDFVIVEFARKASLCYYVGRVTKERDEDGDIEVEFMKRKGGFFIKPTPSDIASVHIDNVKAVLPEPTARGTTNRTQGEFVFTTTDL